MLIHHDEKGFIDLIQSDPGPEALANLMAMGGYIDIQGVELPPEPLFNAKGEPILDNDGEQIVASRGTEFPELSPWVNYVDVKTGEVKERPVIPLHDDVTITANGADRFTLEGLPRPIVVKVDGVEYEITDGKIVFSTKEAGTYRFTIDQWPYVPWSMKVTAL